MEETLILRLPQRLANRVAAELNQQERAKKLSETSARGALLQRHRRPHRTRKSKTPVATMEEEGKLDEKKELNQLMETVWGEEGAPDYDSMDEVSGDLLDLVLGEADAEEEEEGAEREDGSAAEKAGVGEEKESMALESMDYWRVEGKEYIFQLGSEQYHATLVNLPCVIETQKLSADQRQVYKTGNVGQLLIVHDCPASAPRQPEAWFAEQDLVENGTRLAHGVTPPMHGIAHRYAERNYQSRRRVDASMVLETEDIAAADELMSEMKELVLNKNRKHDIAPERPTGTSKKNVRQSIAAAAAAVAGGGGGGGGPLQSTIFCHEEIIDSEAWMEHHPDDVIVVEPGADDFFTSTKEQYTRARNNLHKKREEEKLMGAHAATHHHLPTTFPGMGGMGGAGISYIPTVPLPMEYGANPAFQPARQQQSPEYFGQGGSPMGFSPPPLQQQQMQGSPNYGNTSPHAASPYGHQSTSPSFVQSPISGATGGMMGSPMDDLPQDPVQRAQELRRNIAALTEQCRTLNNPQLRLRKEAQIVKLRDELMRLEQTLL